jgi:hypothetical protein
MLIRGRDSLKRNQSEPQLSRLKVQMQVSHILGGRASPNEDGQPGNPY